MGKTQYQCSLFQLDEKGTAGAVTENIRFRGHPPEKCIYRTVTIIITITVSYDNANAGSTVCTDMAYIYKGRILLW